MTWADSVKAVLWIVSIGALLFLSAGTLDWPNAWIFTAEFVIGGLAVTFWLAWRDPVFMAFIRRLVWLARSDGA